MIADVAEALDHAHVFRPTLKLYALRQWSEILAADTKRHNKWRPTYERL